MLSSLEVTVWKEPRGEGEDKKGKETFRYLTSATNPHQNHHLFRFPSSTSCLILNVNVKKKDHLFFLVVFRSSIMNGWMDTRRFAKIMAVIFLLLICCFKLRILNHLLHLICSLVYKKIDGTNCKLF